MITQTTDTREAVAETNKKFMSAFEQRDADRIGALYTDNAQILPPGYTVITGKENIVSFWKEMMEQGIKRIELNTLEVDPQGDTAIEGGRGKLYSESEEVIGEAKYLVVWKREGEQWKLHRDMWNSDTAPEEQ